MRAGEHLVSPEEVMAYLDGELDAPRAKVVQGHLATCEGCHDVALQLQDVSTQLIGWQVEEPEALLPPQASTIEPSLRKPWSRRPRVWRFASAAAVLGVFTAWYMVANRAQLARVAPVMSDAEMQQAELDGSRAALTAPLPDQAAEPRQTRQIVRKANLTLIVTEFAAVKPAVDRVLQDVGGFLAQIQVNNFEAVGQTMTAVLRVPATRLDDVIRALKGLGHATTESQSGDDVGEEVTDLDARLANARNTEARLADVLRTRTGNVSEVLEVEREIARVRGEIERMVGRREDLQRRITYATLTLHVSVRRQASLSTGPVPVSTELRNAFVEGLRYAYDSALLAGTVMLSAGPVVVLWTVLLWIPVRALLRARRARRA